MRRKERQHRQAAVGRERNLQWREDELLRAQEGPLFHECCMEGVSWKERAVEEWTMSWVEEREGQLLEEVLFDGQGLLL